MSQRQSFRRITLRALLLLTGSLAAHAAAAATFVVDSTGDEPDVDVSDGLCRTALDTCTLRAALEQANALAGADTIAFDIAGSDVRTITPLSPLPALTDDAGITIDGYSQPGASPNTLAAGDDAVLRIELDGEAAGPGANGLDLQASSATIRGLVINRFTESGILVSGGSGHRIAGSFLGTDPSGTSALPNRAGIQVESPTMAVVAAVGQAGSLVAIGGTDPGDRNVVSGNANGIVLVGTQNCSVRGNYVGTDSSGHLAVPNAGDGIGLSLTSFVEIGGAAAGAGNVVSGNGAGILVVYSGFNLIQGNRIGTDAAGVVAVANGSGLLIGSGSTATTVEDNQISGNTLLGVRIVNSPGNGLLRNLIGTDATGTLALGNGGTGVQIAFSSFLNVVGEPFFANTIAYNGGPGVAIGTSASDASNDNSISANSIHDNAGPGIDLGSDGVTGNSSCAVGTGPNLLQNSPILTDAVSFGGATTIAGTLNAAPHATYRIEFFSSNLCDPSGRGEGETYLGTDAVSTGASCDVPFQASLPVDVPAGSLITATATDAANNTSEFSACLPLATGQSYYTIPPCRLVDTRQAAGPNGGPALSPSADRAFGIAGQCGIPADARAVAFNFTVTQPTASGDLQIYPAGTPLPVPATLFYSAGQTRAKNGVLALGTAGNIGIRVDQAFGTVDLVLDATGYFR